MPHVAVPRLLEDGGSVGVDARIQDVQSRVETLVAHPQGPPINLSQRLAPAVVREASRPLLRPDRTSRPVASRRERGAGRSQANPCHCALAYRTPDPTLHLRTKYITMFSMPQLKFVRREAGGACAGRYVAHARKDVKKLVSNVAALTALPPAGARTAIPNLSRPPVAPPGERVVGSCTLQLRRAGSLGARAPPIKISGNLARICLQ